MYTGISLEPNHLTVLVKAFPAILPALPEITYSLEVFRVGWGGINVDLQNFLEVLLIFIHHSHLPLNQQDVLLTVRQKKKAKTNNTGWHTATAFYGWHLFSLHHSLNIILSMSKLVSNIKLHSVPELVFHKDRCWGRCFSLVSFCENAGCHILWWRWHFQTVTLSRFSITLSVTTEFQIHFVRFRAFSLNSIY